jgi:hypothetical protein
MKKKKPFKEKLAGRLQSSNNAVCQSPGNWVVPVSGRE